MIYQILGFSEDKTTRFKRSFGKIPFTIEELKNMVISEEDTYILTKDRYKIIYDKYVNIYILFVVNSDENPLYILEIIKRFLCLLDLYFEKVCDIHLLYNFDTVYKILDEFILNGKIIENNNEKIMKRIDK